MTPKILLTLKRSTFAYVNITKNLFKKNVSISGLERESFLNSIALPNLKSKIFDICEGEITEKDLITALESMPNGKSPGHDGLTKEFYEHFCDDLRFYFINSSSCSKSMYMGNWYINVTEMCGILDIPGYLVTMNTEKAFRSWFSIKSLKKIWLWWKLHFLDKSIIKWSIVMRYKWRIYNSIF